MNIALVNTNRMKPAIAPIGLDYLAEVLNSAGHQVAVLDLCWSQDSERDISNFFSQTSYPLVGISLRNTDDCAFTTRQSFVHDYAQIVNTIRRYSDAYLVCGGVGFSIMPELILSLSGSDFGVWGEGEYAFLALAEQLSHHNWAAIPNLIWRNNGQWFHNASESMPLEKLPTMTRRWFDNRRYFREGGQIGFETKRGCPFSCVYCADPIAKGKEVRLRPPKAVAVELQHLLDQGIDCYHTCDSEFNIPPAHASAVCQEIIARHLADKIKWYAYCSPTSFSYELAQQMARAGCVGINFGVDNGDEKMLRRLKRDFTAREIETSARHCKNAGIRVMFDLLLGSPGETKESITTTIELMKKTDPHRVGVTFGVRLYPGTELTETLRKKQDCNGVTAGPELSEPIFFFEPGIAPDIYQTLSTLIRDDERFLFFNPENPNKNYNYSAHEGLVQAIKQGHRGAYWDILSKLS
ncbi:B12-binding domain-containing radical SAM protein [candidate division CSSED10-310 bacterium]|uniref:B12-binding domain-containing radical SAM protein n=1 Tax=candidate division CSSED10-310 bacterium TaxID=2855610 RepID=A0ABV6Z6Z2_UNCC1